MLHKLPANVRDMYNAICHPRFQSIALWATARLVIEVFLSGRRAPHSQATCALCVCVCTFRSERKRRDTIWGTPRLGARATHTQTDKPLKPCGVVCAMRSNNTT